MSQNLNKFTIPQLKAQLRARSLKVGGKKAELIARLMGAGVTSLAPVNVATVQTTATTQKVTKPKRQPKLPADVARDAIAKADLSFGDILDIVFEMYGRDEKVTEVFRPGLFQDLNFKLPPPPIPTTREGLSKLKVVDLKKILKSRGEKLGGKKAELIERVLNPTPKQEVGASLKDLPPITGLPEIQTIPVVVPLKTFNDVSTEVLGELPIGTSTSFNDGTTEVSTEVGGLNLPMIQTSTEPSFYDGTTEVSTEVGLPMIQTGTSTESSFYDGTTEVSSEVSTIPSLNLPQTGATSPVTALNLPTTTSPGLNLPTIPQTSPSQFNLPIIGTGPSPNDLNLPTLPVV